MSAKENNSDVALEKSADNEKSAADGKCEIKGTKRPAEDKAEDVKKAKKEENGAGSDIEDIDDGEEESIEGDDDEEDDIPEGEEEELDDDEEEEDIEEEIPEDEDDA